MIVTVEYEQIIKPCPDNCQHKIIFVQTFTTSNTLWPGHCLRFVHIVTKALGNCQAVMSCRVTVHFRILLANYSVQVSDPTREKSVEAQSSGRSSIEETAGVDVERTRSH